MIDTLKGATLSKIVVIAIFLPIYSKLKKSLILLVESYFGESLLKCSRYITTFKKL
jgi:hypothetical protein